MNATTELTARHLTLDELIASLESESRDPIVLELVRKLGEHDIVFRDFEDERTKLETRIEDEQQRTADAEEETNILKGQIQAVIDWAGNGSATTLASVLEKLAPLAD